MKSEKQYLFRTFQLILDHSGEKSYSLKGRVSQISLCLRKILNKSRYKMYTLAAGFKI